MEFRHESKIIASGLGRLLIAVDRVKEHPRQGCGLKNPHARIFTHPRLAFGRYIEIKRGNVLSDRFG
jgi:hypothetical protein